MMNKIIWLNVKNRTPRNGTSVLAIVGGSVKELHYKDGIWGGDFKYHVSAITHWAYLNKPRVKKVKHVEVKQGKAPLLMNAGFESFQSPLDGSVISCPSKLRAHNKKHGVTNIKDYGADHFEKRGREMQLEATGQTAEAKQERKELIDQTLSRFGV